MICGLVWGLWVGFAIVAAGTFLGEVGNFYAFKYLCRGRAEKYERDNLNYAIMAHVVRDGGFFFIFAVRMSAIPGCVGKLEEGVMADEQALLHCCVCDLRNGNLHLLAGVYIDNAKAGGSISDRLEKFR